MIETFIEFDKLSFFQIELIVQFVNIVNIDFIKRLNTIRRMKREIEYERKRN